MFIQPTIIDGDWDSVRQAIQKISVFKTGSSSEAEFSKLTIDNLSGILKAVSGAVTALGAATNGQIPIGSTGNDPVLAAITGTANQITVTNAAGSITLSLPQNIHSAATPTFAGATFTGFSGLIHATAGVLSAGSLYVSEYGALFISD